MGEDLLSSIFVPFVFQTQPIRRRWTRAQQIVQKVVQTNPFFPYKWNPAMHRADSQVDCIAGKNYFDFINLMDKYTSGKMCYHVLSYCAVKESQKYKPGSKVFSFPHSSGV